MVMVTGTCFCRSVWLLPWVPGHVIPPLGAVTISLLWSELHMDSFGAKGRKACRHSHSMSRKSQSCWTFFLWICQLKLTQKSWLPCVCEQLMCDVSGCAAFPRRPALGSCVSILSWCTLFSLPGDSISEMGGCASGSTLIFRKVSLKHEHRDVKVDSSVPLATVRCLGQSWLMHCRLQGYNQMSLCSWLFLQLSTKVVPRPAAPVALP